MSTNAISMAHVGGFGEYEAKIREATDNMETGISVGGRIVNTIRYADVNAVVSNSQKGLQQLMDNLEHVKWLVLRLRGVTMYYEYLSTMMTSHRMCVCATLTPKVCRSQDLESAQTADFDQRSATASTM